MMMHLFDMDGLFATVILRAKHQWLLGFLVRMEGGGVFDAQVHPAGGEK